MKELNAIGTALTIAGAILGAAGSSVIAVVKAKLLNKEL